MKVFVINWQDISNPYGGGAEVHLHEIFKRIVSLGHEVTLFCSSYDGALENETIDGIKIIRKGSRNLFNYYVKRFCKQHLSEVKYDIVVDDINKIPFYTPSFIKIPLLAISHHFFGSSIFKEAGLISGCYVYASEKLIDFVYKKTPFTVVSQSTLDEFLERGFDEKNFTIIPNAIEQSLFPMQVMNKTEYPTITYFGRLKKYKSVDHVIEAFKLIESEFWNAKLNIVGSGDYRPNLEKLVKSYGLENKVTFYGFVSDEEKVKLLTESHCVVNPSMKEGWGITNIEANACGTPVISANVPGLKDSVLEGKSGVLYSYGKINELADKMRTIINDNEYRENLSKGSVEWAKEFSWDASANQMLDLLQKVITDHHHTGT